MVGSRASSQCRRVDTCLWRNGYRSPTCTWAGPAFGRSPSGSTARPRPSVVSCAATAPHRRRHGSGSTRPTQALNPALRAMRLRWPGTRTGGGTWRQRLLAHGQQRKQAEGPDQDEQILDHSASDRSKSKSTVVLPEDRIQPYGDARAGRSPDELDERGQDQAVVACRPLAEIAGTIETRAQGDRAKNAGR